MRAPKRGGRSRKDRGAAALEVAIVSPVLTIPCFIIIDYCRLFYFWITINACAYNGALYASNSVLASGSGFSNLQAAALADASNLSPSPTVSSTTGTDANGKYVSVKVTYTFKTLFKYPKIPTSTVLNAQLRMVVIQ